MKMAQNKKKKINYTPALKSVGCITDKYEASVSLGYDLLRYTTQQCQRCYNGCAVPGCVCGSGGLLVTERRRRKMEELF